MSDKKQLIIPPGSRLPAAPRSTVPRVPELTSGNAVLGPERMRYDRNALTVAANTRLIEAKASQYAAFAVMVAKKEELMLALASYEDLPDKITHQRELGRMSRTAELRREELQYQLAEINLKIEVTAATMRLAETLPIPQSPPAPPPPPPAPAPMGLTPDDVQRVVEQFPDIKPETIGPLILALGGMLAEKKKT